MKVAIVGTAPSTFPMAPWDDPEWEIWCLNDMHVVPLKRWDRWFQVHPYNDLDFGTSAGAGLSGHVIDDRSDAEKHIEWAKGQSKPIYCMAPDHHLFKRGVAIPKEEMIERYGTFFLSSAVAWMMAVAIDENGITDLGLYGVDMAETSEYAHMKPGVKFFKWVAEQKNIKVHIPIESELYGDPPAYPDKEPMQRKIRRRIEVNEATLDDAKLAAERLAAQASHYDGQLQVLETYRDNIQGAEEPIAQITATRNEMMRAYQNKLKEITGLSAQLEELRYQAHNWT